MAEFWVLINDLETINSKHPHTTAMPAAANGCKLNWTCKSHCHSKEQTYITIILICRPFKPTTPEVSAASPSAGTLTLISSIEFRGLIWNNVSEWPSMYHQSVTVPGPSTPRPTALASNMLVV
jgi:hypothetical protein